LYKIATIRSIAAAWLLIVFTFGNTPKQFLHDALTNHQHHYRNQTALPIFSVQAPLCDCSDTVVESTFYYEGGLFATASHCYGTDLVELPVIEQCRAFRPATDLRGPPSSF
jgi:hypothetical protein